MNMDPVRQQHGYAWMDHGWWMQLGIWDGWDPRNCRLAVSGPSADPMIETWHIVGAVPMYHHGTLGLQKH